MPPQRSLRAPRALHLPAVAAALAPALLAAPSAAQVQLAWATHIDGLSGSNDFAEEMAVDASGNMYIVGSFAQGSSSLVAVVKVDADGRVHWVRTPPGFGVASEVELDPLGNVYVGAYLAPASGAQGDFATMKYAPDGTLLWLRTHDGPGNHFDFIRDLAVHPFGRVAVTGSSIGIGTGADLTTVVYDTDGQLLWARRHHGLFGADWGEDVAFDGQGGVVVTGTSNGRGVTIHYGPDGTQRWIREFRGSVFGTYSEGWAVAVDGEGNVDVLAEVYLNPYLPSTVLIQYGPDGVERWSRFYRGPLGAHGNALVLDAEGNVHVVGWTYAPYKCLAIRCTKDGEESWVRTWQGPHDEGAIAGSAVLGGDGTLHVAGSIGQRVGTIAFDRMGNLLWHRDYIGPDRLGAASAVALGPGGEVHVAASTSLGGQNYDFVALQYVPDCASAVSWYCTGKLNSQGCLPALTWSGTVSASSGQPFVLSAEKLINQQMALLAYSLSGPAQHPFGGGTLCVRTPAARVGQQSTSGSSSGADCTGTFAFDLNAWIASGADPALAPGATVHGQVWSSDPGDPLAPIGLTDAVRLEVCP